jgi:hypothetical protein
MRQNNETGNKMRGLNDIPTVMFEALTVNQRKVHCGWIFYHQCHYFHTSSVFAKLSSTLLKKKSGWNPNPKGLIFRKITYFITLFALYNYLITLSALYRPFFVSGNKAKPNESLLAETVKLRIRQKSVSENNDFKTCYTD